ncbi:hypothetical protein N7499_002487 [Penicillium canescens]|nr:hypothetical protein N7499_002487 [Penicillium canescens]KAJ6166101.1 hypothetical protein N7485_009345 [Penicillium canescens]
MITSAVYLLSIWAGMVSAVYIFQPDNHTTWKNTRIPTIIDPSEDQNSGSYWTSAFLTTTTGRQFLLIQHQFAAYCKSSVLDLGSLEYWKHVDHCEPNNDTKTVTSDSLSLRFPNFSVVTTTPDKVSGLELYAKSRDYSFTLNVECRTSKMLMNGGNGVIAWGADRAHSNTTHWSIPAARTSGLLTLGKSKPLALDPAKSFAYYDHQNIFGGAPNNFTWFEAHFPNPNIRVSIWAYDWADSSDEWRYATVRVGDETMMVLPYIWQVDWDDTWVSGTSNRTYPQRWTLTFENGDYLTFKSVKKDQEMLEGTWTGFATIESRFMDQTSGFGIVDQVYV